MTNLEKLREYLELVQEEIKTHSLSEAIEVADMRWGWKYGQPRGGSFARSEFWHPAYEAIWEAANIAGKHNPCWQVAVELREVSAKEKGEIVEQAFRHLSWLEEETTYIERKL